MEQSKRKLLDIVRDKIRFKHYSISTERTYVHWIKHYIFTRCIAPAVQYNIGVQKYQNKISAILK